jgi:hypothetical protein
MDDAKQSSTMVKLDDEEGVKRILVDTVFGLALAHQSCGSRDAAAIETSSMLWWLWCA